MKQEQFEIFLKALLSSTELLGQNYFILPVAYEAEFVQRERAYCYELYSLIRNCLPKNFDYTFSGEINKAGHPLVAPICGNIIPDFLVHKPGFMGPDDNLVIIEVKTIEGANIHNENLGLLKDIRTLNCMTSLENGYFKGIILIFGKDNDVKKENIINIYRDRCNQDNILILFHNNVNQRAIIIN